MAALTPEDAAVLERAEAGREEWPDGTYAGTRSSRTAGQPDPDAADHVQELTEALEGWRVGTRSTLADRAASHVPPSQLITEKRKP
ncbi:hypothetical protein ACIQRW_28800 [Streptomyces sp. NPDC091287]|uniref:hypothetical protein n=1 Tax=unclassified Streptomyces TaxID=2593676 RepID=UPI0033FD3777